MIKLNRHNWAKFSESSAATAAGTDNPTSEVVSNEVFSPIQTSQHSPILSPVAAFSSRASQLASPEPDKSPEDPLPSIFVSSGQSPFDIIFSPTTHDKQLVKRKAMVRS
jgi:hypothetical protein